MMRAAVLLLLATTATMSAEAFFFGATKNSQQQERNLKKDDDNKSDHPCAKGMETATMFGIDPFMIGGLPQCNGDAIKTDDIACFPGTPQGACQSASDCSVVGEFCIVFAGTMPSECGTEATITGYGFTAMQVSKMCDTIGV